MILCFVVFHILYSQSLYNYIHILTDTWCLLDHEKQIVIIEASIYIIYHNKAIQNQKIKSLSTVSADACEKEELHIVTNWKWYVDNFIMGLIRRQLINNTIVYPVFRHKNKKQKSNSNNVCWFLLDYIHIPSILMAATIIIDIDFLGIHYIFTYSWTYTIFFDIIIW